VTLIRCGGLLLC